MGNLKGRTGHLGDPDIDGKIILKWVLRKLGCNMWNGCILLMTGTNGRLL
jgi:hypothetical protein